MGDKVKNVTSTALQKWKAISKKAKIMLGCGLLAVAVVLAVVVLVVNNRPYTTLFTDLSQSDMTAILNFMSDNGITQYKVEGDAIFVPENQEATLKARVLQAGYPSSGYGYGTYLDNVGSLTTESERNQLVLYGLQDRMEAVIRNFDGVKEAIVLLTPGEDHTYVLDSSNKIDASAAVTVTMDGGKTLTDGQVDAIRNLVSHGLAGLNVENVAIGDTYGNTYSSAGSTTDIQDASSLKMKLEEQWNNNIRTQIMQALIPLYGENNVRVSVNTVVNVDRTVTDSTDYTLEEWAQGNDDGIIGSQIWEDKVVRGQDETTGGEAGTSSNADLDNYVENQLQTNGTEEVVSSSGQTDHLVDTDKTQVERMAGYISDVMVSVTINQDVAGGANVENLYTHVARAAGIAQADQQEKISVLIAPFYQNQDENPIPIITREIPKLAVYAAIIVGGVLLLLLIILLLLHRGRVKRRRRMEQELAGDTAVVVAKEAESHTGIMEMQTDKSMEMRQSVRKFADDNPEIAAQMVKNWLREGDRAK